MNFQNHYLCSKSFVLADSKSTYLTLRIGNMHGICCQKLLEALFEAKQIEIVELRPGELDIDADKWNQHEEEINAILNNAGLYIIMETDAAVVASVKQAIHELIFNSGYNISMVRNSDYLVEKIGFSYQRITSVFSKQEKTTIEKYIIHEKISKVKELLIEGELSLSEISYMMGYSSVQYLSTQFKQVTGKTVTDFKK